MTGELKIRFDKIDEKVNTIQHVLNHNPARLGEDMPKAMYVYRALFSLLNNIKSSRAYVLRFHNGSSFSTNFPVWKLSLCFECLNEGVEAISEHTRDIIVANILPLMIPAFNSSVAPVDGIELVQPSSTYTGDEQIRFQREEIPTFHVSVAKLTDTSLKGFFMSRGIRDFFYSPVFDQEHQIVGLVCSDYLTGWTRSGIEYGNICMCIKETSAKISGNI